MSFSDLQRRLSKLEGSGGNEAVLVFESGTRTGLQARDALGLVCAAMRAESAKMDGQEPEQSKYAGKLVLLRRAERIETADNLLSMAFDVCKGGVE